MVLVMWPPWTMLFSLLFSLPACLPVHTHARMFTASAAGARCEGARSPGGLPLAVVTHAGGMAGRHRLHLLAAQSVCAAPPCAADHHPSLEDPTTLLSILHRCMPSYRPPYIPPYTQEWCSWQKRRSLSLSRKSRPALARTGLVDPADSAHPRHPTALLLGRPCGVGGGGRGGAVGQDRQHLRR